MNLSKKTVVVLFVLGLGALSLTLPSCHKDDNNTPAKMTLYDSLGGTVMVNDPAHSGTMIEKGRLGLRSVVDSAIFVIAADAKINSYFTTLLNEVKANNLSGFQALSKNLTDFFCVATGAKNFSYTGKNMTDAHNPAANARISNKVNSTDFDQFTADVVIAAQKNGLSSQLIGQVGVVINSVKTVVVQR